MHVREARRTRRSFLGRRGKALAFALLYLVAVFGLPSLHLALHRDNHHHRDGGIHFHTRTSAGLEPALVSSHGHGHFHPTVLDDPSAIDGNAADTLRIDGAEFRTGTAAAQRCQPASRLRNFETPPELQHVNGSLAHFASAFLSAVENPFHRLAGPALGDADTPAASQQAPKFRFPHTFGARGPPAC